jgi:calcineurin-like phosphoesterase family protein
MSRIWLTSDTHFCHDKEFVWQARGFNNVDEMNKTIVKNWNAAVGPEDTVYILGDCMMGMDYSSGINYLSQLNGLKYIAYGNHDTDTRLEKYRQSGLFMDVAFGYRLKYVDCMFILTHYPQYVANMGEEKPLWNLHGHTHSKEKFSDIFHAYNVALDAHNNIPVCIDDIIKDIKENK